MPDDPITSAATPLSDRCRECLCPECFPPDSPCPDCHGRGIGAWVTENHRPDEMTVTYGD